MSCDRSREGACTHTECLLLSGERCRDDMEEEDADDRDMPTLTSVSHQQSV